MSQRVAFQRMGRFGNVGVMRRARICASLLKLSMSRSDCEICLSQYVRHRVPQDLNFDVSMGCLWLYSGKVFGMAVAEIVKNNTISLNN